MKWIKLKEIKDSPQDYELLEKKLKKFFQEKIYIPLLKELRLNPRGVLKNASHPNPLMDALFTGQVTYSQGAFRGTFNSSISKELRALGAKFDRKTSSYKLPYAEVPSEAKAIVSASLVKFEKAMKRLDGKLAQIVPSELADQFHCEDLFDKTIYRADKSFKKNVKNITVSPELTEKERSKIASDWQNNTRLSIRDWTDTQIKDLRKKIYEDTMAGARRESFIPPIQKITQTIQESHETALRKARFLAHQESRLLMAKFKETHYVAAGVPEYEWRCVHRPHDENPKQHTPGNVRYSHGKLEGKIFRWDDPPISTNPGQPARRNNPGQDYYCRCFGRPVLRKR